MKRLTILGICLAISISCTTKPPASTAAVLTISPRSLDFGNTSAPATRVLSLTNDGAATLHVLRMTVSEDARGAFQVGTVDRISSGDTVELTVTYSPPAAGSDSATLSFETDSRVTPQVLVSLLGRQGEPTVDASTDAGFDAGEDASVDAGRDAGTLDAGPFDAGRDAGAYDAGPAQHRVFIVVSGLAGANLEVTLNGASTLKPPSDGTYLFLATVGEGSMYSVAVTRQPEQPSQTCQVMSGTGTQGAADVQPIQVQCDCGGRWTPIESKHVEVVSFERVEGTLTVNGELVVPSPRLSDSVRDRFIQPLDGGARRSLTVVDGLYAEPLYSECGVVWVPTPKVGFACCGSSQCYVIDPGAATMTRVRRDGQPALTSSIEMVPFGDSVFVSNRKTGERAIFRVAAGEWSAVPPFPYDAGCCSALAWAGGEVLSYGGDGHHRLFGFNPSTQMWTEHTEAGGPTYTPMHDPWDLSHYLGIESGNEYVVLAPNNTGGRYDPASHVWKPLPDAGTAVTDAWRARLLPIDGGVLVLNKAFTGGVPGRMWTRADDKWVQLDAGNSPTGSSHLVAATDDGLTVMGGLQQDMGATSAPAGSTYWWRRATNTWTHDGVVPSTWVGSHGGSSGGSAGMNWSPAAQRVFVLSHGDYDRMGGLFDPTTQQWSSYPTPPFTNPTLHAVTAAGGDWLFAASRTGATYNLTSKNWVSWPAGLNTAVSLAASSSASEPVLAYVANRLFIWLGVEGYVLNPATNTYIRASSVNAPSLVTAAQSVSWAVMGGRIAVWGGLYYDSPSRTYTYWNTGSIYDVASDTWEPIATSGAPAGRVFSTAGWTGRELAIVGGYESVTTTKLPTTIALYDPAAHSWREVTPPRLYDQQAYPSVTAVGDDLILWTGTYRGAKTSGYIWNTATDVWSCMAVRDSPARRARPLTVWTGSQLMIYAGSNSGSDTGGLFTPP